METNWLRSYHLIITEGEKKIRCRTWPSRFYRKSSRIANITRTQGQGWHDKSEDVIKKEFDLDYVKVDQATLFELILAANYMDIKELLDLCCQTVANMIKGKTPAEIRKAFNIKNDFTQEEEDEVQGKPMGI